MTRREVHHRGMDILVIDGQGGGRGKAVVSALRSRFPSAVIMAAGTNSTATQQMVRAGADHGATGENPVAVMSRKADVLIGPVGIVIADSMHGEVTPAMAASVGQSDAKRILIPVNLCDNIIVGVPDTSLSAMIEGVISAVEAVWKDRQPAMDGCQERC